MPVLLAPLPVADTALSWVDALKAGGPYLVAVVCAWVAWTKDVQWRALSKEHTDTLIALVERQTQVSVEQTAAIRELREAFRDLARTRG